MEEGKKKNKTPILAISVLIGMIAIIIIILIFVLNGSEKHISEDNTTSAKQEVLHCTASTPLNPFFEATHNASGVKYDLKVLFEDSKVNTATFSYKATFNSNDIAKSEISKMHWNYDDFMGKTSIHQESLTPVFGEYNNEISISLFFDKKYLVSELGSLLFLDQNESYKIQKYSLSDLKKIYRSKNFSCKDDEYNN